jgi:hypothetical protein
MPTKTKAKTTTPVTTDTYDWHLCEYGSYRIVKTRYDMFKSIDKLGNDLITGLTEQAVHDCTPLHILAQQPDYDGRYDTVIGSAAIKPDL